LRPLHEMLGYRRRTYTDDEFSVQIKSMHREGISVSYKRQGTTLDIRGERTDKKWEGLQMSISEEIVRDRAEQIALDLEKAFREMNYEYTIIQGLKTLATSKKVKP